MKNTLYINLNLFDGLHDKISKHVWMLVNDENGKIVKIGAKNPPKVPTVVNLHDKYVMPGLFNVHTHVTGNPNPDFYKHHYNTVTFTLMAIKHLHQLLKSGVTYVRGCGSSDEMVDTTLNKLEESGQLKKVPEMMPAGNPMTMTGGHGDGPYNQIGVVDSPEEMTKAVRLNFKNGAECTKVMTTGGVMSPGDDMTQAQLTIPEIKAAVHETHAKHSIVAAHAEGNPGIMNAILGGVDSIEHGYYVNDKEIDLMIKKGIYLTPTLLAGWVMGFHDNEVPKWVAKKDITCKQHGYKNIGKAYKKGVKLTMGTDAGCEYTYFTDTPKELELMVKKLHMTNFDALTTIKNSADLMQLPDYGTLEPGKVADFLVLDKNPLADVKAVQQKDKGVYKKGVKEY